MNGFNVMHFRTVNESVTANPVFCPLFGQKSADLARKSLFLELLINQSNAFKLHHVGAAFFGSLLPRNFMPQPRV
jgi:hypothetical protein